MVVRLERALRTRTESLWTHNGAASAAPDFLAPNRKSVHFTLASNGLPGANESYFWRNRPLPRFLHESQAKSGNHSFALRTAIPNSLNCLSLTGVGASTIRSTARAVFGNGITSRNLSAPARIITLQSTPIPTLPL